MSTFPPNGTRFDLKLHLLGFPLRVHPGFWLAHTVLSALLAFCEATPGLNPVIVFLLTFPCTTGSVLVHELGHVVAARCFGGDGEIELAYFGGFVGTDLVAHSRCQRIIIILAGPLATLLVAAAAGTAYFVVRPSDEELHRAATEKYLNTTDQRSPVQHIPPPADRAALELVLEVLFGVNVVVFLLSLVSHPDTDMGAIIKEYHAWRKYRDEPDCEQGPDGWKRE